MKRPLSDPALLGIGRLPSARFVDKEDSLGERVEELTGSTLLKDGCYVEENDTLYLEVCPLKLKKK
jgi:hypothetical protein